MAIGDAYVFPGFLTPVLTQLFSQSHRLLFSHASAEVRGENTPERKVASTGDQTHNHQVMSPTRSPLSHSGGAVAFCNSPVLTEAVYIKLGACVHYPKSNPYYQWKQLKMLFLSELCPFFFELHFLSSIKHPTEERWHPQAVLLVFFFIGDHCINLINFS